MYSSISSAALIYGVDDDAEGENASLTPGGIPFLAWSRQLLVYYYNQRAKSIDFTTTGFCLDASKWPHVGQLLNQVLRKNK